MKAGKKHTKLKIILIIILLILLSVLVFDIQRAKKVEMKINEAYEKAMQENSEITRDTNIYTIENDGNIVRFTFYQKDRYIIKEFKYGDNFTTTIIKFKHNSWYTINFTDVKYDYMFTEDSNVKYSGNIIEIYSEMEEEFSDETLKTLKTVYELSGQIEIKNDK